MHPNLVPAAALAAKVSVEFLSGSGGISVTDQQTAREDTGFPDVLFVMFHHSV